MAVRGQITINSDVASSVITVLTNSCSTLESDVSGKLSSSVNPLVELGFVENSLSKITSQISTITSVEKQMISSISSHIETVSNNEDQLYNGFSGGGGYSGGGGGGGGSYSGSEEAPIAEEDDGKKVNCEKLCEIIPSLDETSKVNLLKCVKFYKDKDTNFIDLLMDTSYCEELFTIIKKAFGDSLDIENMTLEEMKKVQRILLDTLISKDVDISKYDDNSILVAKPYLIEVCVNNNITPSELIFDEKNRSLLKQTLKNVYNGNVNNTMSSEDLTSFKTYIDKICLKNNTTAEELIDNKVEILL